MKPTQPTNLTNASRPAVRAACMAAALFVVAFARFFVLPPEGRGNVLIALLGAAPHLLLFPIVAMLPAPRWARAAGYGWLVWELNEEKYWNERDPHAKYDAVSDACWLYQDRELEQNLRRLEWRKARKRVLGRGALGREWMGRGRGELRLGRRGLQMRFADGARVMGWKELQGFIRARRS